MSTRPGHLHRTHHVADPDSRSPGWRQSKEAFRRRNEAGTPGAEELLAWPCFPLAVPVLQPRNEAYLVLETVPTWVRSLMLWWPLSLSFLL